MSISKILVPVTGSRRDGTALRTAFAAARPFDAHVAALFIRADARDSIPYSGLPLSPEVIQSLIESAEEISRASSKAARGALALAADEASVRIIAGPERCEHVTASYSERTGHFSTVLEEAALLCDLIVFPGFSRGDNPDVHDGFTRTLIRTERPVLLSPEAAPDHLGTRIALGWDGGMAAARALSAAFGYLEYAEHINVFCFSPPSRTVDLNGLKVFLALHGVSAETVVADPAGKPVGELLLESALKNHCDLLVMGGYGHSRALETLFGGVTQHIVSQPRLPVLMVH